MRRGGVLPLPRLCLLVDHPTLCPSACLYLITSSAWKRRVGGRRQAHGLGGLQVDDQLELHGLLYGAGLTSLAPLRILST